MAEASPLSGDVAPRRRPAELHRLLLEAAERVTIELGSAASADAIAREAGVTRSVLYRHFGGRDDLIAAAAQGPFDACLVAFRAACYRQDNGQALSDWEIEREFMRQLFELFRAHHSFLAAVLSPRSPLQDAHKVRLRRKLNGTIDELVTLVVAEIQTRERGYEPSVVSAALRLEVAMVSGLVAHADWLLPRGDDAWSTDEMLDHVTAFTLFGARQHDSCSAHEATSANIVR